MLQNFSTATVLIVRICALSDKFSAAKLNQDQVLEFPSNKRWLNGEEYTFMLRHYRAYKALYPEDILIGSRSHP